VRRKPVGLAARPAMGGFTCISSNIFFITAVALCAGCTGGQSNFPTNALVSAGVTSDNDQTRRPARVATTVACAQAYGLAVDATKLRSTYLGYESKQGATRTQLATIESNYDTTYQSVSGHCSVRDGEEIKANLLRYQAGYFTPRTPLPEPPFDVKTVWDMQD
jgi:hypothetical protein